jgi:hypothetical protein
MDKEAFFAMAVGPAQASQRQTGVPASVTLAQAILESGWGDSHMGDAWNFFGIKAHGDEPFVVKRTREIVNGKEIFIDARFRRFASMEDCFCEHGKFLRDNPRYAPAFKTTDCESFARAVHAAGYATAPNYGDMLVRLIRENNLGRYDVYGETADAVADTSQQSAQTKPRQLDMRTIQQTLKRQGFDRGPIDGEWGDRTKAAVKVFQKARGLEVDGVVGPKTMAALVAAATPKIPVQPAVPDRKKPLV